MGLFGKKKADPVEALKQQVSVPTSAPGSFSLSPEPEHKEVVLVEGIKGELTSTTRDLIRQPKKRLEEIDKHLGKIEAKVHNIKIYEAPMRQKATEIETKLLQMRGGNADHSAEDLSQDEFEVISYLKENDKHVMLLIRSIRELRHLIDLVLEHPLDLPFSDQQDVARKAEALVGKVHDEIRIMNKHFSHIYDLEEEVEKVAQDHDVKFDQSASGQEAPK